MAWDYIIVGGGTAGPVSEAKKPDPDLRSPVRLVVRGSSSMP